MPGRPCEKCHGRGRIYKGFFDLYGKPCKACAETGIQLQSFTPRPPPPPPGAPTADDNRPAWRGFADAIRNGDPFILEGNKYTGVTKKVFFKILKGRKNAATEIARFKKIKHELIYPVSYMVTEKEKRKNA